MKDFKPGDLFNRFQKKKVKGKKNKFSKRNDGDADDVKKKKVMCKKMHKHTAMCKRNVKKG